MSMETYEKTMFLNDAYRNYRKLEEAELAVQEGAVKDAFEALKGTKEKYDL